MKVVMIGTGYVGLVSGVCLAEVGHHVTCVDIDQDKIALLQGGASPIYEPGLTELMAGNVESGHLVFTSCLKTALQGADVCFIAVGTPQTEDGSAELTFVHGAAKGVADHLAGDLVVVVKSTVPVGTCDGVEAIIHGAIKDRDVSHRVVVASNPEFLREGSAIRDFMNPDRVIVGVQDKGAEDMLRALYEPIVAKDPSKMILMKRRSSELSKYAANAMLATRISFVNELSQLCEAVDGDIEEIRRGMGSDTRIGPEFLSAGPGFGGSCFPKDVSALIKVGEKHQVPFSLLNAVISSNELQKHRVSQRIRGFYGDLKGKQIGVWGLAFKPGTDDVRQSPAITIIKNLVQWGATVVAHDPEATENFKDEVRPYQLQIHYARTMEEAASEVDGLVLLTEWQHYRRPDWGSLMDGMKQPVVFDYRNQYDGVMLRKLGYSYQGIGVQST